MNARGGESSEIVSQGGRQCAICNSLTSEPYCYSSALPFHEHEMTARGGADIKGDAPS